MIQDICVAGAGTMGSGIALAAALGGFDVIVYDTNEQVIERATAAVKKNLGFLLEKNKISETEHANLLNSIRFTTSIDQCRAGLVIEAIVEIASVKAALFNQLAAINAEDTILASNTSSLSITAIQLQVTNPCRVAGMHFFNPAHIMKLVEVVSGEQTSNQTTDALVQVCKRMNKTAVLCKDSPGFIVNRVARHYYLEAMKLVEEGIAGFENVDAIMEATGFKMGPFRLMDLIGMDINLAVSQSLYDAFAQELRFKPSALQQGKVAAGELGKKTGKGFYTYNTGG